MKITKMIIWNWDSQKILFLQKQLYSQACFQRKLNRYFGYGFTTSYNGRKINLHILKIFLMSGMQGIFQKNAVSTIELKAMQVSLWVCCRMDKGMTSSIICLSIYIYEGNVSVKISDDRFAKLFVKCESGQKEVTARIK